jgi:hypothetical protein
VKKWGNQLNRAFSKEEVQISKKEKKRQEEILKIPGHKGNVNQNHLTPFRMGVIKENNKKKFQQECGER